MLTVVNSGTFTMTLQPWTGAGSKGADFLVVDINYFPGYEKLPNHAALMVDFLQSLLKPAAEQGPAKEQGTQVQRHLSSCLDDAGSDSE